MYRLKKNGRAAVILPDGFLFGTDNAKVAIKKVKYDSRDQELDIDFNGNVKYKSVKVIVKDASGRKYTARITEKGKDDLEVKITGLKRGKTYTVTVVGVALKSGTYMTVSKSFSVK